MQLDEQIVRTLPGDQRVTSGTSRSLKRDATSGPPTHPTYTTYATYATYPPYPT